jgi:hypothetical protein
MKTTTQIFLLLITSSISTMAHAASCDQLRDDIQIASNLLNKAQEAKSFNDAKRLMNNAKSAISEVAEDSRSCPCMDAANLFDDAAAKIRRASDADGIGRFNEYGRQGVEIFGAAIDALNNCPESQKNPQGQQSLGNESSQSPQGVEDPQGREQ